MDLKHRKGSGSFIHGSVEYKYLVTIDDDLSWCLWLRTTFKVLQLTDTGISPVLSWWQVTPVSYRYLSSLRTAFNKGNWLIALFWYLTGMSYFCCKLKPFASFPVDRRIIDCPRAFFSFWQEKNELWHNSLALLGLEPVSITHTFKAESQKYVGYSFCVPYMRIYNGMVTSQEVFTSPSC